MKPILALTCLALCSCASTGVLDTKSLTKDEIKLEQARIVNAREVRNDRWARIGETAGSMAINIAGSWFRAWLGQADDDGFAK